MLKYITNHLVMSQIYLWAIHLAGLLKQERSLVMKRLTVLIILVASMLINMTSAAKAPAPEMSSVKAKPERPRCVLTGFFKIKEEVIHLESVCTIQKKGVLKIRYMEVRPIEGKYSIPGTNSHIYLFEGKPILSYTNDGKKSLGVLPKSDDGYTFQGYMKYLFQE